MSWIVALLSLIAGYFFVLAGTVWFKWKASLIGKKMVLILVFKNCGESAEAIMWDLFRLKSWNCQDVSFMVIDDKSDDDTLFVLKTLRKRYPFLLISSSLGKRFERVMKLQGKKVVVLKINGWESPSLVRKKIVSLFNQHLHEQELANQGDRYRDCI